MSQITTNNEQIIHSLVINGDLSKMDAPMKVTYYKQYCERLGLDPFTQPFRILKLNGKEVLYCDRSGTQQLNKLHKISHLIQARETTGDCYVVTAKAFDSTGRQTESIGAVSIAGLKGESLCNAMMKAETKAKRRSTLDLLGLGILDESEADTIPGAQTAPAPIDPPDMKITLPPISDIQFFQAKGRIGTGEISLYEKLKATYALTEDQHAEIKQLINTQNQNNGSN